MADNLYDNEKHGSKLYAWGQWQMMRGAGWSLVGFMVIIAIALILLGIKALLPVNPNAVLEPLAAVLATV